MSRNPEELTSPLVVTHAEEKRRHPTPPEPVEPGKKPPAGLQQVSNPKLVARNLNFYYGKFHALQQIDLQMQENGITALIGPSGCGKSTLLRCFNRIYNLYPDQKAIGEVLFDGRNILGPREDLNLLRARIGMVFQKPTPFPMSIFDNIAFGVKLYERLGRADMEERV